MFINCTNHRSELWSEEQKQAAAVWGEIRDLPFPSVCSDSDENQIKNLAEKVVSDIEELNPDAVLCQGEFTLCFAICNMLIAKGIPVYAACSERIVTEELNSDGQYKKHAIFEFRRYREYKSI